MARRISKSYLCAVKCMYALVKFLDEENRECSRPEIFEHMQRHVNFTYWESEHMGSTIRWQLITRNMAYHYQRAGLLTRREEVYRITPKGREVLDAQDAAAWIRPETTETEIKEIITRSLTGMMFERVE